MHPNLEYYNREVKRLKIKARTAYEGRKFGELFQTDLKTLSRQLLAGKKRTFLRSVLQNEGKCWRQFYKYVKKRCKENRETTQSDIYVMRLRL